MSWNTSYTHNPSSVYHNIRYKDCEFNELKKIYKLARVPTFVALAIEKYALKTCIDTQTVKCDKFMH